MKLFTVYFNDEPQPISISADNEFKALSVAMVNFKDRLGQITVVEDTTSGITNFVPVKVGGHRDFGKKVLSEYQGRVGVVLTDQEIGTGKFICVDRSDQEYERLCAGQEITLRLGWDSQLADADEWWEFENSEGTIYKVSFCNKNEIDLRKKDENL